jgi:hypothetical protein
MTRALRRPGSGLGSRSGFSLSLGRAVASSDEPCARGASTLVPSSGIRGQGKETEKRCVAVLPRPSSAQNGPVARPPPVFVTVSSHKTGRRCSATGPKARAIERERAFIKRDGHTHPLSRWRSEERTGCSLPTGVCGAVAWRGSCPALTSV